MWFCCLIVSYIVYVQKYVCVGIPHFVQRLFRVMFPPLSCDGWSRNQQSHSINHLSNGMMLSPHDSTSFVALEFIVSRIQILPFSATFIFVCVGCYAVALALIIFFLLKLHYSILESIPAHVYFQNIFCCFLFGNNATLSTKHYLLLPDNDHAKCELLLYRIVSTLLVL